MPTSAYPLSDRRHGDFHAVAPNFAADAGVIAEPTAIIQNLVFYG
jgi:hypothetical protein